MGYTRDAIKGLSWMGALRIAIRGLSYFRLAIIARILSPAEFGTADVALIVLGLVEILTETGINIILIQEKDDVRKYIDTAWIVSITRGILIASVIIVSAPFVVSFVHSPASLPLLRIVSIVPIVRGFINPSVVNFLKGLVYRKEFTYKSSVFIVETFSTILIVLVTNSAAGIVWGLVIGAVFEVCLSFLIARPIPKIRFNRQALHTILHRGKWLTAAGIFNYLYQNADNIIVVRMLGQMSLGLYMRAYSISMLPITEIADVFNRATFPIFAKISDDKRRLRRAFLKTTTLVGVLVFPVALVFFFFPQQIIMLVLGKQWIGAAGALQVLALFGCLKAISNVVNALFLSLHKQDVTTKISFITLVGLLVTIVPFIHMWGIVGAAAAALFGTVISYPFLLVALYRALK